MDWDRRNFIKTASASVVGLSTIPQGLIKNIFVANSPVCVFTKCLQFMDYDELGEMIAKTGFNGADLTVRKNGHVFPENVKNDLPKAVKALRKSGVDVPMIVTDITDANQEFTEDILFTARDLGIQYYRMGYFRYNPKHTVFESLDNKKRSLDKLERLNRKYGIQSGYQNHSGPWGMIGGAIWDLHYLFEGFSPEYVGIQYDIAHATAEGGYSWKVALKIISPWINSLAIKDFLWEKGQKRWETKWVPLGDGMVNFTEYSDEISSIISSVPVTVHYEYDLGGAELGKTETKMTQCEISKKLMYDLQYFKNNIIHNRL